MTAPKSEYKVLVVGDGYIGKTSMLLVYKDKEFSELPTTVCDMYTVDINRNNTNYKMSLVDVVGQENYERFHCVMFAEADLFIVCYSVDNRASFTNIPLTWKKKITELKPKARIILVGTKTDTRPPSETDQKFVSKAEGFKMSRRIKAEFFVECSAKEMRNVNVVFERAMDAALMGMKPNTKCSII